jgi:hypothetical protein|tara:strand:+ start:1278 stop:1679 length:402 start_codon:yes stop_codon:yes gene_type:complete
MKNKRAIRKTLKNSLNLRFNIKALSPTQEQIDRSLFIDSIETMVEIQDRTEFMLTELGIDAIAYEDKYFRVIENLFRLCFNKEQLSLIQLYLYELIQDKEWNGQIELELKGQPVKVVDFKSAKQVWEVINLFK